LQLKRTCSNEELVHSAKNNVIGDNFTIDMTSKMMTVLSRLLPLLIVIPLLLGVQLVQAKKHPKVLVFIIAGDGNVEGFASKQHLHQIVTGKMDLEGNEVKTDSIQIDNRHLPYQHLWNATNSSWVVRDDVFVAYDHYRGKELLHGPLSVGSNFGGMPNTFGPEIHIGTVLGNLYQEPVVIVKAGWDGRNLAKDFASPSKPDSVTGYQWYRMIDTIHKVGNSLHEILGDDSYKYTRPTFGGLVWWHGYPDFHDHRMYAEYGDNLVRFINDIRAELKRPSLPVIVGELGGKGKSTTDKMELDFRQMQEKTIDENCFNRTVVFVPTAIHVRTKPAIKNYTSYFGNAPTMIDISQAFAAALISFDSGLTTNLKDNAGFDWVIHDSDVLGNPVESSSQANEMFLLLAVVFVLALCLCFSFSVRRTWNTAFSRLPTEEDR
jgi:Carbohydrate esterase, sialic acid-specific acetylesterase